MIYTEKFVVSTKCVCVCSCVCFGLKPITWPASRSFARRIFFSYAGENIVTDVSLRKHPKGSRRYQTRNPWRPSMSGTQLVLHETPTSGGNGPCQPQVTCRAAKTSRMVVSLSRQLGSCESTNLPLDKKRCDLQKAPPRGEGVAGRWPSFASCAPAPVPISNLPPEGKEEHSTFQVLESPNLLSMCPNLPINPLANLTSKSPPAVLCNAWHRVLAFPIRT